MANIWRCGLIVFLLVINVKSIFAETFDAEVPQGNNYDIAKFRIWIPDSHDKIKAILVIVPGYNADGRNEVNDETWQDFARKHDLAIVACCFRDRKDADVYYREASKGSGQALLDGIARLSDKSKRDEIADLPLIFWGFSAGGQFNYEFVCWNPQKVLAFVVNKGGYYHTGIASQTARRTPGIFFIGANDLYYRKDMIKGIYSVNRKFGALWTLLEEDLGHTIGESKKLSISYFSSIISKRLGNGGQLNDLNETDFYLGNWDTKEISECDEHKDFDFLTVCLPDLAFAKIWEKQFN